MSDQLIDPGGIPLFTGDLDKLTQDISDLKKQAGDFRTSGASVNSEFQGLNAFYKAPEAEKLFATTAPVATKSDSFAGDLEKAADALSSYEDTIRPLVGKLAQLKSDACDFVSSVEGDSHWREHQDKVDRNNSLWHGVNDAVAAFWDAERTCHNKITALVHGSQLTTDDGSHKDTMYGFKGDDLNHADKTPWGSSAEREYTGLSWLWHQTKSFVWDGFIVDGVWGTVRGLGTLVGVDGWDNAGKAWVGLAKLSTAITLTTTPGLNAAFWMTPDKYMPGWLKDSRKTAIDAGKSLVAWDEWSKNPARAAGGVSFNILTIVGTEGAGAVAKGGAVAKALSVVGKAGKLVDPMTYIIKAGKLATLKIGDLLTPLRNVAAGRYTNMLSDLGKVGPDGTVVKVPGGPHVSGDYIEWPDGTKLNLKDNTVIKPDGSVAPAPGELSAADRKYLNDALPHEDPVPVGARPGAAGSAGDAAHPPSAVHDSGGPHNKGPSGSGSGPGPGDHPSGGSGGHTPSGSDGHTPGSGGHPTDNSGAPHTPQHGSGPGSGGPGGHDGGGHGGNGGHGGDGGNGGGGGHGGGDHQPMDHSKGPEKAPAYNGPMSPEHEAAVADELKRAKLDATDQERVMAGLKKSKCGARAAELISSGKLAKMRNYDEVLKLFKQVSKANDMSPAATMALEHAADLQARGFPTDELAFEIKDEHTGLDLDVTTLKPDGTPGAGYQLKDVNNIEGISSAVRKVTKQLTPPGADLKVGILDVHQPMSAMTEQATHKVEEAVRKSGATFQLRFTDGSMTFPGNGGVYP